jgi:hypothetical protein
METESSSNKQDFTILMVDDDIDDQNFVKMAIHKYSADISGMCE